MSALVVLSLWGHPPSMAAQGKEVRFQSVKMVMKRPKLASFKQIKLGMSLEQIYQLVGRPLKDSGSGLYILHYTLDDGSFVVLSYGHPQYIKISHTTKAGEQETIEVK